MKVNIAHSVHDEEMRNIVLSETDMAEAYALCQKHNVEGLKALQRGYSQHVMREILRPFDAVKQKDIISAMLFNLRMYG